MGLFAAQTPFLNGKPCTLFLDRTILYQGSVGLAFLKSRNEKPKTVIDFDASSLYPITEAPLKITKCQGNIILKVQGGDGAAKVLVDRVHEDESKNSDQTLIAKLSNNHQSAFVAVTGGDLSKGALSLDTLADIHPGTMVEFYRVKESLSLTNGNEFNASARRDEMRPANTALPLIKFAPFNQSDEKSAIKASSQKAVGVPRVQSEGGLVFGTPETLGGHQMTSFGQGILGSTHL